MLLDAKYPGVCWFSHFSARCTDARQRRALHAIKSWVMSVNYFISAVMKRHLDRGVIPSYGQQKLLNWISAIRSFSEVLLNKYWLRSRGL